MRILSANIKEFEYQEIWMKAEDANLWNPKLWFTKRQKDAFGKFGLLCAHSFKESVKDLIDLLLILE